MSESEPEIPETISTYLRLRGLEPSARRKKRKRGAVDEEALPFMPGRDPRGIGEVLGALTRESGWDPHLAREDLVRRWDEVAGAETARHTHPVDLTDGTLTVKCDSTAWAKQLQLIRAHVLTEILRRFPDAGVQNLRFLGPDVPSWKWGTRAVQGRGPRDTYG